MLDAEAVGQLLAAEAGAPVSPSLITAIGAHTGGNPFFAKEVTRHLAEERALREDSSGELETSLPLVAVPEGVRQVLAPPPRAGVGGGEPAPGVRIGICRAVPFPGGCDRRGPR